MRVRVDTEYDLNNEDDAYEFVLLANAHNMSHALFDIREACRSAEKQDHTVDHLIDVVRSILRELPTEAME